MAAIAISLTRCAVVALALALPVSLPAQPAAGALLKKEALRADAAGDSTRARALFAKALTQDPAWSEGWWKQGTLLYQEHQFQPADQAFGHLIRLAPDSAPALAMLGMCEFELGEWPNASLHLNKAFARGGLPAKMANTAMYDFGLTLLREHNRNGALIAFRLLQHNDPTFPDLLAALGAAELGLEQLPSPGDPHQEAVELAGRAAVAVLQLKSTEADTLYRSLVQRYPDLPNAHLCLALFLENAGMHEEAERELKAETLISRGNADAWIWLARLALARRDAAATHTYVRQALAITPNDGVCYLLSGRGYILDQQWSNALEALQHAEALAPDSYEVHHALITVYSELHDTQGADAERRMFTQTFAQAHPAQAETP